MRRVTVGCADEQVVFGSRLTDLLVRASLSDGSSLAISFVAWAITLSISGDLAAAWSFSSNPRFAPFPFGTSPCPIVSSGLCQPFHATEADQDAL